MVSPVNLLNTDQLPDADSDNTLSKPRKNAATGASAAGVRALSAQMVAFYFRVPVKAFFRTRVEYASTPLPILPHTS
jgi:hypothetical protein